jgi:hypothetical protein
MGADVSQVWAKFELCPREPVLDSDDLPSLPLSLLASVSRNDLMELDLYKDVNPPQDEMASPLLPSWISIRGPFDQILNAQPWQSYAPVIRRARQSRKISCLTS